MALKGKLSPFPSCFLNQVYKKATSKFFLTAKRPETLPGGEVNFLAGGEVNFFNRTARIVEMLLDREVRRCFKCQGYGHVQGSCRASNPSCGKCAGTHFTRDCTSQSRKCVNCKELTNLVIAFAQSK